MIISAEHLFVPPGRLRTIRHGAWYLAESLLKFIWGNNFEFNIIINDNLIFRQSEFYRMQFRRKNVHQSQLKKSVKNAKENCNRLIQ